MRSGRALGGCEGGLGGPGCLGALGGGAEGHDLGVWGTRMGVREVWGSLWGCEEVWGGPAAIQGGGGTLGNMQRGLGGPGP